MRRRLRVSIGGTDWPVLDQIASDFNLAPTTLRRRLNAEGAGFQGLKDDLRRDAAIHYLCNTTLDVSEVAGLLRFQEVSAFRPAFKKWTGGRHIIAIDPNGKSELR